VLRLPSSHPVLATPSIGVRESLSGLTAQGLRPARQGSLTVPQQLYSSAVAYYAQYRPGYPQDLVDALAAGTGLDGTQHMLDIGCGTGQVTIPLARHARTVVAIDPVAGMLARG